MTKGEVVMMIAFGCLAVAITLNTIRQEILAKQAHGMSAMLSVIIGLMEDEIDYKCTDDDCKCDRK